MNKEKQRILIAEACGWTKIHIYNDLKLYGIIPYANEFDGQGANENYYQIPDYLNDLNMMREAAMILNRGQRITFERYLADMFPKDDDGYSTGYEGMFARAIHATATQRAEAFLKTLGKWEDDK